MKKDRVAFFLPTRKGSERIENKNTKPFAGFSGGLLENKLNQLSDVKGVDEILLSSNDNRCIQIAESFVSLNSKLNIDKRPDYLCLGTTNLEDLIGYVPTLTTAEHILWGHVTTPLVNSERYDDIIKIYLEKLNEGYDSLITVTQLQNFVLDNSGALVNNKTIIRWPRTQDLEPLYEINHAVFLTTRENYIRNRNRVGVRPFLYIMNRLESIDVDWDEDFIIAEQLYRLNCEL